MGGLSEHWTHREPGEHLIFDGMPFDVPWREKHVPVGAHGFLPTFEPGTIVKDRRGQSWVITRLQVYTDAEVVGFPAVEMMCEHVRIFATRWQPSEDRGLFQFNTARAR